MSNVEKKVEEVKGELTYEDKVIQKIIGQTNDVSLLKPRKNSTSILDFEQLEYSKN